MANVIIIPDGSTERQQALAPGDLLVLGPGETLTVDDGNEAVLLEETASTLLNDGAIAATGAPGVLGLEADVRIVNGATDPMASITSDTSAIVLDPIEAAQEVTNLGTIDGTFNGIDIQGLGDSSFKVFNAGTVTSESRALNIVGDDVQLVNQGVIRTTEDPRNGVVYTDTEAEKTNIFNAKGGLIEVAEGQNGDAVSLQIGDEVAVSFSNAGTIQGRGEATPGGEASGVRLLPGSQDNPTVTGAFLNKGLIASEATEGISAGFLIESGIEAEGQLLNQGTISGPFNGLYLGNGDFRDFIVFNGTEGLITSASRAVNIDGQGLTFVNEGLVTHTADARNGTVYANASGNDYSIVNTETGIIDAGEGNNGDAISLELDDEVHAEIFNHGHVLARGEAALAGLASGIRLFSQGPAEFRGEIENSGRVSSEATTGISAGILVEDNVSFIGEITNTGDIFGPFNGIYIGDNDHLLTITNAGSISSDSRAVNIGGDGVTLENDGTILGTGDSRNGVVYADDESNEFTIRNNEPGVIDAGEGNDGHAVSVELGAFSQGFVRNDGLVFGRGESAGIRLFSNPETAGPAGSLFEGQVLNHGIIHTEGGAGILIEENVALDSGGSEAAVVVTGDILAALALDARAMTEGLSFAHGLGDIEGALRFGSGDDEVALGAEALGGGGFVQGPILLGAGDDVLATGTAEIGAFIALGVGHDVLDALEATSDLKVFAGAGDDNVQTGAGDDRIFTGAGDDLVFSGAGDDLILGGSGDDVIDAGAGFDVVFGGAGDDQIFGAAGFDVLAGGDGADTFFFGPTSDIDIIADFNLAEGDLIDLSLFALFATGAEAYAAGGNVDGDAVWDFGEGRTLTLQDVDYDSLSGDQFIVDSSSGDQFVV